MDQSTANYRHGLRAYAQRVHLPEFWRWWSAELRALVPAAPRNAMQRRRLRPVLVFHREAAVLWAPQTSAAGVAYVETARIPLQGDAAQVRESGAAAIDALARGGRRSGDAGPRVIIALTSAQVLRKTLTYPAAVQENLAQVLGYELDRHTPFKADELYYDAFVVARDAARGEIRVELVAALKSTVDQLRRQAAAWGCTVLAVTPGEPQAGMVLAAAPRINLVPESERVERSAWRSWQTWVPIGAAGALALAAIIVPLVQKREAAIELLHVSEQARVQAAASDALRQQLERSIDDYNFVLARKYAFPSTLQLLQDVTRLLPDDTWLTVLEMKSVPKGKEPHREIMLKGESGNAGRLVSLLEDSHLFEQAAPRSPTTKIQPGPGE
ncbi:MAG: PilN domain-containing protein, partial [Betaproteobacteria bacterium]